MKELIQYVRRQQWSAGEVGALLLFGIAAAVLALGAFAHALYLVVPPDYYVEWHGDTTTARQISLAAIPTLLFVAFFSARFFWRFFAPQKAQA